MATGHVRYVHMANEIAGSPEHFARFFSHDQFDFEVQLVLARDAVPFCRVGGDGGEPAPLGWGTWLRTQPFARDADETVLTL